MTGTGKEQQEARYPCPGCGAQLAYSPGAGALACPYCGRQEAIPVPPTTVTERPFDAALRDEEATAAPSAPPPVERRCGGCGASVTLPPGDTAGRCPFCTSSLFEERQPVAPWVAPEGVLPFAVPAEQAAAAIRLWIASRWFAPNALRRLARTERAEGIYLPFWTFDSSTTSTYTGQRGEHYWDTERYTVRGAGGRTQTATRRVRRTRWHPAAGTVARAFDDVLVPATRSVDPARLSALAPWDLTKVAPFDTAYLAGFRAQRHQVELAAGFEEAKKVMARTIFADVRGDIGGDEQRVLDVQTEHAQVTYKHLLLPVWIAAYRFHGKVYQVAVNARSGEVHGERPYSFWKIAGLVVAIAAAAAAFIVLNQR